MAQGQRRVIEGQFGQVGVARRQGLTTGVEKKAEKAKKKLDKEFSTWPRYVLQNNHLALPSHDPRPPEILDESPHRQDRLRRSARTRGARLVAGT
jgi:hypothetical protein